MQKHEWREQTEDGLRFWRATYHSGEWSMASQAKGEEEWTPQDTIRRTDWEKLREVLWRKYQRKRCPWELIEKIDQRLETMPGE